jgi:hypothetical protein
MMFKSWSLNIVLAVLIAFTPMGQAQDLSVNGKDSTHACSHEMMQDHSDGQDSCTKMVCPGMHGCCAFSVMAIIQEANQSGLKLTLIDRIAALRLVPFKSQVLTPLYRPPIA